MDKNTSRTKATEKVGVTVVLYLDTVIQDYLSAKPLSKLLTSMKCCFTQV